MHHTSKGIFVKKNPRIRGNRQEKNRDPKNESGGNPGEPLQRLDAARGAINSLMGELKEDHIRNQMPRNSKTSEEAADYVIQIVRTYLK